MGKKQDRIETLSINGEDYVKKSQIPEPSELVDGLEYVVIRARDSGCHAGYLASEVGDTITLVNARRLWYWSGAASLSQLAEEGVVNSKDCKFPQPVRRITVYRVCEKISTSEAARINIEKVPVWKL